MNPIACPFAYLIILRRLLVPAGGPLAPSLFLAIVSRGESLQFVYAISKSKPPSNQQKWNMHQTKLYPTSTNRHRFP